MRLDSAVEEYLTGARQEGKSPTTVRHYRWHLNRLVRWLGIREAVELAHVTRSLLRTWGAGLREEWAPATIKQAVCATRSFFAWCTEEGWLEENPALALRVPRVPRRVQRTLTDEEVRAMLRACDDSPKGRRDAAGTRPGVGLGLAISRHLARRNHALLTSRPNPPGGACFVLSLPRA